MPRRHPTIPFKGQARGDLLLKGDTIDQLRQSGCVSVFLQFGSPGETAEEIEKTPAMVQGLMPDEIGISVSCPLPGTPFYERVKGKLGEKRNWEVSEDLAVMSRGTFEPEFYRLPHTFTHKERRIWQGQGLPGRLRRRRGTIRAARARLLAALTYHSSTIRPLESALTCLAARREREDLAEG